MSKRTKRAIKFLSSCNETEIIRSIVKYSASYSLVKSICNAALNCASGEISLTECEKLKFQKHRLSFQQLTKKQALVNIKKFLLANKLGLLRVIPTLLDCVLRSIGTSFIVEDTERKNPSPSRHVRISKVHFDQSERTGSHEGEENQGIQPSNSGSGSSGEEH